MPRPGLIGHLDQRNQRLLTGQGSWPVNGHGPTTPCIEVGLPRGPCEREKGPQFFAVSSNSTLFRSSSS